MTRRGLDRRALVGLLAGGCAAAGFPGPARAQPEDPAVALVNGLYDGVRLATALGPSTVATRLDLIEDTILRTFDFPEMTRLAYGGVRWRNVPPAKQAALVAAFTRYFSIGYANRLSAAIGSIFEVQPTSEPRGEGRLVRTKVTDVRGNSVSVDYVVRATGRVGDVLLAGTVSEVATLRSEFEGPVKSGGPEALEAYMRQRGEAILAAKPPG